MRKSRLIPFALLAVSLGVPPLAAQKPAAAPAVIRFDLNNEKEGGEPSKFLSVVGDWSIATDDGKKGEWDQTRFPHDDLQRPRNRMNARPAANGQTR